MSKQLSKSEIEKINSDLYLQYFNKSYSIQGIEGNEDANGCAYVCYDYRIQKLSGRNLKARTVTAVNSLLSRLIAAKCHETPEGGVIKRRECEVHWRQWPTVADAGDDHFTLSLRVSIHHKEQ